MTRYEKIKNSTIEELAHNACYYFSEETKEGCNDCPATNKCYNGHNGMKDYLNEEIGK